MLVFGACRLEGRQMVARQAEVLGPRGFCALRLIGSGATSRVYRGRRVDDGRIFALKRLNRHMVRSSEALARLRRELELLHRLSHPGIVGVYDIIDWGGDPTLVMDYVEGEDLEARIKREGGLAPEVVEDIARQLLSILATAHSAGVVHRDLKPQNVRVGVDGAVTLLDFGSARFDAASQLTLTGTTVGTPEYMAPELFSGSVYDPRVDIFGLGATLFEALCARPPQSADSVAQLAWLRLNEPLPSVLTLAPETPPHLAGFVDRALSTEPSKRFSTASLALWALDHPELERSFGDHRSKRPPCVHCDEPLEPSSRFCPGCKSEHPFGFEGGFHDVVITGMSRPELFIHWLASRFPERRGEEGVLSERCAALSLRPQRYACALSRRAAEAELKRVDALGV